MSSVSDQPVIETHGLTKVFRGQAAVRDLSLEVPPGTMLGVVGPSGSGKTTTVRMLMGALIPTEGDVLVFGQSPWTFSPTQRRRMGYMPQQSVLYPHLSLQENLRFVASMYGMWLHRPRRLREVLDFVELTEDRRKLLRETSGGMQRRLALAATLVHEPELLFLDEPTTGIGPIQRRKFWEHFEEVKQAGRTLVVTTQNVNEAGYCDLVAIILDGQLLAFDHPDELRRQAFGGEVVVVSTTDPLDPAASGELSELPLVENVSFEDDGSYGLRILVSQADTAIPRLQEWFSERGVRLESITQERPPFDEVFVHLVEQARGA